MIKTGTLFAIPLSEVGFVTGHVVLSLDDPETRRRVGKKSRLNERGTLLLDVLGPPTPEPDAVASHQLVRGIWTDAGPLEGPPAARWTVIGHREVEAARVEFPERVIWNMGPRFERGEILKPLSIDSAEVDSIGCKQPFISLAALAKICLSLVGRADLLGTKAILFQLDGGIDLRYHPRRAEIYRILGEDPDRSYWDWATAEGLDPGRLWR